MCLCSFLDFLQYLRRYLFWIKSLDLTFVFDYYLDLAIIIALNPKRPIFIPFLVLRVGKFLSHQSLDVVDSVQCVLSGNSKGLLADQNFIAIETYKRRRCSVPMVTRDNLDSVFVKKSNTCLCCTNINSYRFAPLHTRFFMRVKSIYNL